MFVFLFCRVSYDFYRAKKKDSGRKKMRRDVENCVARLSMYFSVFFCYRSWVVVVIVEWVSGLSLCCLCRGRGAVSDAQNLSMMGTYSRH